MVDCTDDDDADEVVAARSRRKLDDRAMELAIDGGALSTTQEYAEGGETLSALYRVTLAVTLEPDTSLDDVRAFVAKWAPRMYPGRLEVDIVEDRS